MFTFQAKHAIITDGLGRRAALGGAAYASSRVLATESLQVKVSAGDTASKRVAKRSIIIVVTGMSA